MYHGFRDWLNKAGAEVPKTTDELYEVLKKFKELNIAPDAVPVSMDLGDNAYFNNDKLRPWLSMFSLSLQMGEAGKIENDTFKLWLDSENYKEMLLFTHKLFEEKLLDNNTFTNDVTKVNALSTANKVGLSFGQTTAFVDTQIFKGIAPPKSKFGDPTVTSASVARDGGTFAITNSNKYPEATIRWIDYFYGEEGSEFFRFGIEGVTYTKDSNGNPKYSDEIMNFKPSPQQAIGKFTFWPGAGAPHIITAKNAGIITSPLIEDAQDALEPYMPDVVYGEPLMDPSDADKFSAMQEDIRKFVRESMARFIIDGVTEEKWSQYKQTLQTLGIDEYEAYYQRALDGYNKN
ncbi:extracellular solute-binding protein [Paenibacillus sp. PL2-23]|uniref:extracellular solute-binding protein n=1 Tax=Paenibacillus sp. PL2-23 TaxID=2100729 RepID=UPI0030F62414